MKAKSRKKAQPNLREELRERNRARAVAAAPNRPLRPGVAHRWQVAEARHREALQTRGLQCRRARLSGDTSEPRGAKGVRTVELSKRVRRRRFL